MPKRNSGAGSRSSRAYRQPLCLDRILAPPRDVGFEKLFLRDAHLEANSDFHVRDDTVVPRAGAIADCARPLIDAFDDLLFAFAGGLHWTGSRLAARPL